MTLTLRIAFVAATVLTLGGLPLLAVNLWRNRQEQTVLEPPVHVVGQAGLLFAGAWLVTETVNRGSDAVSEFVLFAAILEVVRPTHASRNGRSLRSRSPSAMRCSASRSAANPGPIPSLSAERKIANVVS